MIKPRYKYIVCKDERDELGYGDYLHQASFDNFNEAKKYYNKQRWGNWEITVYDELKREYFYDITEKSPLTKQEMIEDNINPLFNGNKCNTDCPFMGNYGGRYSCSFPDWHLFPMGFNTPKRRIKCINKFNE